MRMTILSKPSVLADRSDDANTKSNLREEPFNGTGPV